MNTIFQNVRCIFLQPDINNHLIPAKNNHLSYLSCPPAWNETISLRNFRSGFRACCRGPCDDWWVAHSPWHRGGCRFPEYPGPFFRPFFSFCFCCFVGICPSVWKIGLASLIRKRMRFDWKPQRCFALDWTLTIWRRGSRMFRSALCLKGFWSWMSISCWPHNGHSFGQKTSILLPPLYWRTSRNTWASARPFEKGNQWHSSHSVHIPCNFPFFSQHNII